MTCSSQSSLLCSPLVFCEDCRFLISMLCSFRFPPDTSGDRGSTVVKVAGSIPAGVSELFIDIKSFRSHYGPGVDSASNTNEYQEYFLGVKAAGA